MSSSFGSRSLLLLGAAACLGGPPDDDVVGPPLPTTGPLDPCRTELSITPDRVGVPRLGGTTFRATGGSGERTFRVSVNQSGGLISAVGGAYVAGPTAGVVDVVAADDPGCGTWAEASIAVFAPMDVRPTEALVPPGTSWTLENRGGSGQIACELVSARSEGTLGGCTWTAGPQAGVDEILVVDPGTDERITASYTVNPGAELHLWGRHLYLPLGHPYTPVWTGGTQQVDVTASGAGLTMANGVLTGNQPGSFTVDVVDRYAARLSTTFEVDVVAPRTVQVARDGERAYWGEVLGGDIDQDGHADAVVTSVEPTVGAHFGGGAYVYAGGVDGLDPTPVVVVGVAQQYAYAGRGADLGDVNGDGWLDLAVGADGYDASPTSLDHGRVDVYFGRPGAFFASEPSQTRIGEFGGDHLGHAVAICDVDGDGIEDLAVAGHAIEDRTLVPLRNAEGAVHIWRGGPHGLDIQPTWRVHGGAGQRFMGRRMVSGDIDGDGRCDLAVSSYTVNLDGDGQDGVVWLFTGAEITGAAAGAALPLRVYTSNEDDPSVQLGRALSMGDLDGDGLDDLVAGGWTSDHEGVSRGAAWVFLEADHDGGSEWLGSNASAVVRGDVDFDYMGLAVNVAEGGLWVGAGSDEVVGGTSNTGVAWWFEADALRGEMRSSEASRATPGSDQGGFFGTALASVGDTNGDGAPDLVVFAARDDREGVEAGAAYVVDRSGDVRALDMPADAGGGHLGVKSAVGWFDPGGTGALDLVAGAWGHPSATVFNAGAAYRWPAAGPGWAASASTTWADLPEQGAGDRLGTAVASAGDFDADGVEDLVVVARDEDRPATYAAATYANWDACPGAASAIGAAWVFRGDAPDPSFLIHGLAEVERLEVVDGSFDHDGDGFSDLILGSTFAGDGGGFTVARGRAADPGGILVVCDAEHWVGVSVGSRMGVAVAAVGDLDGDGCDEVAIGADADDLGRTNQGSVRVLWGHGAACAGGFAEVTTLVSGVANDRVGSAVDGGQDVDGDGVPDLVVSGFDAAVSGNAVGAVWLASGAWVAAQARQPAMGTLPADDATDAHVLPVRNRYAGSGLDGEFGSDVALVPDPANGARALVAAGHRFGAHGGVDRSGGVVILRWADGGFEAEPVGIVGGETAAPGGELGAGLRSDPRQPVLAVGAPLSDAAGVDAGAVYPIVVR